MKKVIANFIIVFCSIIPAFLSYAQVAPIAQTGGGVAKSGLGDAAESLANGPISYMLQAFYAACYLGGFALIYKSHAGFKGHRTNPQFVGILMPTLLLIMGIILLCLPMMHYLTGKDSLL